MDKFIINYDLVIIERLKLFETSVLSFIRTIISSGDV